jgi:hypothetical protein
MRDTPLSYPGRARGVLLGDLFALAVLTTSLRPLCAWRICLDELTRRASAASAVRFRVETFANGGVKLGGAVTLQQPQEGGGDGSEIVAALGGVQEQGLAFRRHLCEVVGAAEALALFERCRFCGPVW